MLFKYNSLLPRRFTNNSQMNIAVEIIIPNVHAIRAPEMWSGLNFTGPELSCIVFDNKIPNWTLLFKYLIETYQKNLYEIFVE